MIATLVYNRCATMVKFKLRQLGRHAREVIT
ncbi:hypothetical protein L917_19663 [Phytophthora nicotianae]|uniref:Uncharacterized protein n=1 Tax=Phytophthora nicotianae TaxID=4792 RepID=W2K5E6_PHYNI|nr:hypothetical protein L915_19924 [Phytophthora nicotianae]ETL26532.1 hypothetical protein L916_19805 [Phytophthora nicotianae]ETL79774.1 hypothetical protein L917_19663 [Phytophthora nicotianae]ETM33013.1 hypothetical protein L914_19704 [Phytophthora nicotianae]